MADASAEQQSGGRHQTTSFRRLLRPLAVVVLELQHWVEALLRHWPGSLGFVLRRWYYRWRCKHIGRNVIISPGARFYGHRWISIGDDTHIDLNVILLAGPLGALHGVDHGRRPNPLFTGQEGEVIIGRGVHLAPGCHVIGHGGVFVGDFSGLAAGTRVLSITNHYAGLSDRSRHDVYFTPRPGHGGISSLIVSPVYLGRNTGTGMNCVILPGAGWPEECFLTIGSVAHAGLAEASSILHGNPAVRVKARFQPAQA